jgi:hypothetical protein
MRATNFRTLCVSAALGAALGLTGCVSVHHDRGHDRGGYDRYDDDYGDDYGHPPHGHRWRYGGFDHAWDPRWGVYTVIGFPQVHFHDGWYWRHSHGGYWERCARPHGGHWSRIGWDHVPNRLRPRYGDHRRDDRRQRVEQRRDQRDERHEDRQERRAERRGEKQERVEASRENRAERREAKQERRDARQERRAERREEKREDAYANQR